MLPEKNYLCYLKFLLRWNLNFPGYLKWICITRTMKNTTSHSCMSSIKTFKSIMGSWCGSFVLKLSLIQSFSLYHLMSEQAFSLDSNFRIRIFNLFKVIIRAPITWSSWRTRVLKLTKVTASHRLWLILVDRVLNLTKWGYYNYTHNII